MKYPYSLLIILLLTTGLYAADRPNILFIMSDDHAVPAIGAYGKRFARLNPTPTLDRLAKNGLLFDQCFCTNSICSPSRATILTGQYPQTNGVLILDIPLKPECQYLPIEMKKLGYQTAMIGKWHLHEEPNFDYYQVLPGQGKYFDPTFRTKGQGIWPKNLVKTKGHSSDVITDLSLEWLKQRNDDKPFFLMHHYKAPHDWFEYAPRYENYLADTEIPEPTSLYNQPYFGSVATRGEKDSLRDKIGTSVSPRHNIRSYASQLKGLDHSLPVAERTHQAYQKYLKMYLRCVKGVDDNLARLFAYLKASGQWDNTIILYTGDQGMMFGEHDFQDKRWMYEESMQMPLIIHYPAWIKQGRRTNLLVNNTDFAPTLLEMAGGSVPSYMQGCSFLSELKGLTPIDWRTATYYRYWMHMIHHDVPAHFGLRTRDHKLIFFYGRHYDPALYGTKSMVWLEKSNLVEPTPAAWEFYDLKNDPEETVNRYGDPKYTQIIADMKIELKRQREQLNETDAKYPEIQAVIDTHWDQ
ncbi:sulfatase [Planctomycetota bacterium]